MHGFPLRPTWAEIDLDAIVHNVRQFRSHISPKTRLMAIVKADGYGHGAVKVARAAVAAGVSFLCVGMVEEAIELRENGLIAPILILGFTPKEYAPYLLQYQLTPSVFTLEVAQAFSQAAVAVGQSLAVHIKVDTGMTRVGCYPAEEADNFIRAVATLPGLEIAGLYSHFASADQEDKTFARIQLDHYLSLVRRMEAQGIPIPLKHIANSAAAISMPEAQLDLVRLGISLYGLYPSDEVGRKQVQLRPAMSLKAKIIHVKDVPTGVGVSYGRSYVTAKPTRIATLNIGYGDGYRRQLSNLGQVLVHGQRVPIAGRVCMDQTMICVQDIADVQVGDEVVLFGKQGDALLHVDEVARWLNTINYEVVTSISRRVPRVYLGEDEI
ncbi:MAG: alanine racemase [Firmicutes bacterium]|nr:alanine racemase [Bacillota bacterium]